MSKKQLLILCILLVIAAMLRLYGIAWDQGFNLHPDERAIILFSLPLHFPSTLQSFFSPTSPLNPHFFAYGSFPLYLLRFISSIMTLITTYHINYSNLAIVGRSLSALADIGTVLLVFLLGKKLFSVNVGLLAAFCYTFATFPIQVSHFYAVDTLLTFIVTLTLLALIYFYEKPTLKKSILIGFFFGIAVATKDSALALISAIASAFIADLALFYLHENRINHLKQEIKELILFGVTICVVSCIVFFIFEPYAIIDFSSFWTQTMQQAQMTHNAFTFPYTLQYVGKIPYIYELKNIFLWGLGPGISLFSIIGLLLFSYSIYKKPKKQKWAQEVILLTFFISYVIVVGKFAIGFMRYMLPIYPLLALFAGLGISTILRLLTQTKHSWITTVFIIYIGILITYWPLSFIHIYTMPNTRVQATTWILNHIPSGSTIAVEHWDDELPLLNQQAYHMIILPLYDPDTKAKWQLINAELAKTNYIIIASNRLYVPLQKLASCKKYPFPYCYPRTSAYYHKLFSGKLGFTMVAEFSEYPTIPFTHIRINDQIADESFTVYDHPKVMIFKKSP